MKSLSLYVPVLGLAVTSILSSCVDSEKDLYDPTFKTSNPMGDGFSAPDDMEWSLISSAKVSVEVNDEFEGQYYYVVEIFNENPVLSPKATLLTKGVAKKGERFSGEITFNKGLQTVYIKQTGPTGLYSVRSASVGDGNIECSFRSTVPSVRSLPTTRGFVEMEAPDINDTSLFPTKCPTETVFKEANNVANNGSYKVTGKTTKINLWQTGVSLYVTEDVHLTEELYLPSGCKLFILPGATLTMPRCANNGQANCLISIGKGATFTVNGKTQIDSNYQFYNAGTLDTQEFQCTNNSYFYNAGDVRITAVLGAQNGGSNILNEGNITTQEITIAGQGHIINRGKMSVGAMTTLNCTQGSWKNEGEWYTQNAHIEGWNDFTFNKCKLIVHKNLDLTEAKIILDAGAYIRCETLYMNNTLIEMGAASMLEITQEAKYGYQTNKRGFKGTGSKTALLKIKKATAEHPNDANMIHYSGNIQIVCNDHPEADLGWGQRYTLTNGAEWADEAGSTVIIDKTECNEGFGGGTPTPPVSPNFPITIKDTDDYSYLFEDQWPLYGDYDMNDVVLTIDDREVEIDKNNKVKKFELEIELCAVGATNIIGAAIMFDNIPVANFTGQIKYKDNYMPRGFNITGQGIEANQDYVVVPLFSNAHQTLSGRETQEIINTQINNPNNTKDGKEIGFSIEFDNPTLSAEAFNINKMNVFIIVGPHNNKRREIHVAGFKPTKLANTEYFGNNNDGSSAANGKYYVSQENLAWGIVIPTEADDDNGFRWACEYVNIQEAYPKFTTWVTSSGKEETKWYKHPDTNKVYHK